jgi:predicted Zn-dependent protease with MMP-like domain
MGDCGTRLGESITLYGSAILGNDPNRIANCNMVSVANIEHELGHLLGLDDTSCAGYIMDADRMTLRGI